MPVGAVGRLHDALVVVGEDLAEGRGRAVGEGEVVGLEDEPRRLRGGGDHDVEGAEPEVHERAVARRELGQHAVWRGACLLASSGCRTPANPWGPAGGSAPSAVCGAA